MLKKNTCISKANSKKEVESFFKRKSTNSRKLPKRLSNVIYSLKALV